MRQPLRFVARVLADSVWLIAVTHWLDGCTECRDGAAVMESQSSHRPCSRLSWPPSSSLVVSICVCRSASSSWFSNITPLAFPLRPTSVAQDHPQRGFELHDRTYVPSEIDSSWTSCFDNRKQSSRSGGWTTRRRRRLASAVRNSSSPLTRSVSRRRYSTRKGAQPV